MENEWNILTIKDVCTVTDCQHKTAPVVSEYTGFKMIRTSNIRNGKMDISSMYNVTSETFEKWSARGYLEEGDVVLTREAPMGEVGFIRNVPEKFFLGQRTLQLRAKNNVHPQFLYYSLISSELQTQIKRENNTGSTVSNIQIPILKDMKIRIPDLTTQINISNTLDYINKKIDINDKINDSLECQLKTIFDYWFTQFDFPDSSGKPYKSSGGKMIFNEELKREVPIDWKISTLGDLLKKNTSEFDYKQTLPAIDLSVMPSGSISLNELNTSDNFSTNLYSMDAGDLLFGSIRPYLQKAGIAPCNGVYAGTIHSYKVKNSIFYNFVLATITRKMFFDFALNVSTGSKMPVVSSDSLLSYKVCYSEEFVKKLNDLNVKDTIILNIQENQKLIKLREYLLPLLMNGQATIIE